MKYSGREVMRFLAAGAMNTAATYAIYYCVLRYVAYPVAYTVSYVAGIFLSYVLNCLFVFRARPSLSSALRFPAVYMVQYALGVGLLAVLVDGFHVDARVAPFGVIVFTIPVTYALTRFILKGSTA